MSSNMSSSEMMGKLIQGFFSGLFIAGLGLFLVPFLIGIPMLFIGLAMSAFCGFFFLLAILVFTIQLIQRRRAADLHGKEVQKNVLSK